MKNQIMDIDRLITDKPAPKQGIWKPAQVQISLNKNWQEIEPQTKSDSVWNRGSRYDQLRSS